MGIELTFFKKPPISNQLLQELKSILLYADRAFTKGSNNNEDIKEETKVIVMVTKIPLHANEATLRSFQFSIQQKCFFFVKWPQKKRQNVNKCCICSIHGEEFSFL